MYQIFFKMKVPNVKMIYFEMQVIVIIIRLQVS